MAIEIVDRSTVELIKHNASDEDVAYAAWVSNFASEARNRDTTRIAGLINFLWSNKHTSPFEHGSFTFFVDTPLYVSHEYERHRTWSYNQVSARYKLLESRFYVPPRDRPLVQVGKPGAYSFSAGSDEQYALMANRHRKAFERDWKDYTDEINEGTAREVARGLLPQAIMTQFYATANPLNVLKFFMLRSDEQALHEIREVSLMEEVMFQEAMPLTYAAFNAERELWAKIRKLLELVDIDTLLEAAERGDFGG